MQNAPSHHHAKVAIELANLDDPQRAHVNRELRISDTPRSLYTLARILRAAQMVDEMAEVDRINAAYPAVVAKAA